ncbi:MAG: hypothetical protein B7C24_00325 [Bacteroidetes bacterium 4572_77]|nr:MAG: hypothetical protein B7C24_00325 [Bacteroidetes bacterium 4572_77]
MKDNILKETKISIIKKAIKPFLLMTFFAVILAYIILSIYNKSEIQAYKNIENQVVKAPLRNIRNNLNEVSSDVFIMANQKSIGDMWNDDNTLNNSFHRELSEYFLSISKTKKKYYQVRLIDKNGMESIRINFNNDHPHIVPKKDLQNKKGRYYFEDAISLQKGEIYISPLDLNIEHGKVEQPLKPMIRIATPFFDKNGKKKGIVLLNYFGSELIKQFKIYSNISKTSNIMLLNSDGYWLSAKDPDDEWGFMFKEKKDRTFANRHPKAWETIHSQKAGQFQTKAGIFTFETIYPLAEGQVSSTGAGKPYSPSLSQLNSEEFYWKIVSFIPAKLFESNSNKRLTTAIYSIIILSLLFLYISILFSKNLIHRKTAEQTLRQSEEKFRGLYTSMSLGVIFCEAIYDKNHNMIDCIYRDMNNTYEKFTNLNKETAIANKVTEMLPGTEPQWFSTFGEVVRTGKPISFEMYNAPTKKHYSVSAYKTQENRFTALFEDITERIETNKQITKLSATVEQTANTIVITDTEGNIEYTNPQFTKITGYTPIEAHGKNPRILNAGTQSKEYYAQMWKTIKKGEIWRGEFHNKTKTGKRYWESVTITPIKENDKIINFLAIKQDITKQKRSDEQIRKLSQVVKTTSQSVVITNMEGNITFVNEALLKSGGFSKKSDLIDKSIYAFTDEQGAIILKEEILPIILQEGFYVGELDFRKKDDTLYPGKINCSIILNEAKKPESFVIMFNDISGRKLAEAELIAAKEKAEESNRLKTAFLNNMSHEIRTPLNGITGFLELLQEPDIEAEYKQEYFNIINKNSRRLITTVTDIIEISKIETGLVEVFTEEVSVNKMLQELQDFFSLEAKNKGLKLKCLPSLSDDESLILTDNHKLNGILINLINNAIKFTDKGNVTLGYELKTTVLEFFVKDTGIGIAENKQQAVFDRFEQADIEDTRAFEGSGLGLAIAKSYVEMLGGKIWLSSKEGVGTEFRFTIPYKTNSNKEKKDIQQREPEKQKGNFKALTVLIAEDEKVNTQFFEAIFKNTFKQIIYVETGQEAIEAIKENPEIDLILMDIKMPQMNGYTATREIRKFNTDIIIIAQTAFGLEGDYKKAMDAGCNDYISKPINRKELFEKLEKAINK